MNNNMDDSIEDWVQKLKERAEKRQAKLYPVREEVSVDSVTTCSEREDVSYPPLAPLLEEADGLSLAETTDRRDESSINTDFKRNNTSPPSQLDYSSDLSLECDGDTTTTTTTTNDFYRAEPVVCHSSPDPMLQQYQHTAGSRQASPRKAAYASSQHQTVTFQHQHQPIASVARQATLQQRNTMDTPTVPPQVDHRTPIAPMATIKSSTDDQLMRELIRKIERAENSIKQLSKAVTYSKIGSKEHIEAARLLKIAQVEQHDFCLHKQKMANGLRKKADSLGSLKLYKIGFETRSALKDDLALDGVFHYFFCIASCGPEVKATETIDTDHIRTQKQKDYILFNEELTFADLPPNFVVELQVFEYVKKPMKFVERTLEVLSTPKKSRPTTETEFRRVGFIKLTKDDRKFDEPKILKFENGSKYINKRFRFQMELHPEQMPCQDGMLHVRRLDSQGRPDWVHLWVDLSGGSIRFWKSKQDALDKACPETKVDLRDLCSETVQKLTPDDQLYRQNSFLLYQRAQRRGGEGDTPFQRVLSDANHKIIRHHFAANNRADRDTWCALLDKSMHCFREWNGKFNVYSVDELKELFSS